MDTAIVMSDELAACARGFVYHLLDGRRLVDVPISMSDLSTPPFTFAEANNVHNIPWRLPRQQWIMRRQPELYLENPDQLYYFVHATDTNHSHAILGVLSALTYRQIFRERWGPSLQDITSRLVARGIPFSIFWPSTPLYHYIPSPPPLSDTRRPPTHVYTLLDYNAYVRTRIRLFSRRPFLNAALCEGGILWRLAIETLRPALDLPDCSSGTLEENVYYVQEVELETALGLRDYMKTFLRDYQVRLICGTYLDHASKSPLLL